MKKIFFLFVAFSLIFTLPAWGQTTPTPTPSVTPSRLDQIKERVEERIQDIKEKIQTRAFWGTLKQITNSTLIIDSPGGERRVKTDEETKIFLNKKQVKFEDLEIGHFLIVIGTWDTKTETLTAKRVNAYSKPPKPAPKRQAIFGKVSDISGEEKVLMVTHPKKPSIVYEVKVTDKTVITKKVEGSVKKVNFEDIEIGDRIMAVAIKDVTSNSFTAKLIHVIPGIATGLEKITPTPTTTGTISPTPTPKKPTPTPTE